jgi:hypothetical protein
MSRLCLLEKLPSSFAQINCMQQRWVEFIQDVLITIHENIRDLKERRGFADAEELTHIEAKLLAYYEILSALRSSATEFEIPHDQLGL